MKIFVCSPLRGNITENQRKAQYYCRLITLKGHRPFAPHLFYTQFLDEENEAERELGISLGIQDLKDCHELWAFCFSYESASEGMRMEIDEANELGIPVYYFEPNVLELKSVYELT